MIRQPEPGFWMDRLAKTLIRAFLVSVLVAGAISASAEEVAETPVSTAREASESPSARFDLRDSPSLLKLTGHQPIYFLFGNPNGKIQLSAKNQPFDDWEFYAAYSQLMIWDFRHESSPFIDVNYNPEFFYRWRRPDPNFFNWFDLGMFEHKSNGLDGDRSRGYNSSYVRAHGGRDWGNLRLETSVKLFLLYGVDASNGDIREYMGFWDAEASLAFFDFLIPYSQVYVKLSPGGLYGTRLDRGNQEVGMRFKFDRTRSLPFFYIQYFHGYNESLGSYNQSIETLRVGFWL